MELFVSGTLAGNTFSVVAHFACDSKITRKTSATNPSLSACPAFCLPQRYRQAVPLVQRFLTGVQGAVTTAITPASAAAASPVRQPGTVPRGMTQYVIVAVGVVLLMVVFSRLGVTTI